MMRTWIISVLCALALAPLVEAACTGQVTDTGVHPTGYVSVTSHYVLNDFEQDDVKLYPPSVILGKTTAQLEALIQNDLTRRCEQIIAYVYKRASGAPDVQARIGKATDALAYLQQQVSVPTKLQGSATTTTLEIDADLDNRADQRWEITDTGDATVTPILP